MERKNKSQNKLSRSTKAGFSSAKGELLQQQAEYIFAKSRNVDKDNPQEDKTLNLLKEMSSYLLSLENENKELRLTKDENVRLLNNENLLSRISRQTLTNYNLEEFLNFSLAAMGESLKVSRVYLFNHVYETNTMDNTFEWCAPGIVPQKEELQGVPSDIMPWWTDMLMNNNAICYSDIEEIPDNGVKEILRPQNILSILVVPLFLKQKYFGFIGFDDCDYHRIWLPEDVDILSSIAQIISGYIERKQAEEALKESLGKLNIANQHLEESVEQRTREILHLSNFQKAILDNAGVAIISTRADGIIEVFNPAAEQMLGYKAEEVIGIHTPVLLHCREEMEKKAKEFQEQTGIEINPGFELFSLLVSMMGSSTSEWSFVRKDGSKFPVMLTISSFRDDSGTINGYIGVAMNITERKNAEKSLTWNEALLKKMTESSPLAFLVVDNRTDEILYINHQFCEIWGIIHLEERIRNHELKNNDIIPDCLPVLKDVPAFAESCKPLQSENNRIIIEDEIPFSDGRTIRRFSTQIRDEMDQYHGRLYIFEDITGRKTLEQHLILQHNLTAQLSATANLEEALTIMLEAVFQISGVDLGGIYLFNEACTELNLAAHRGLSEEFIKVSSSYGPDSPNVRIVLQGKPIYKSLTDIESEAMFRRVNQKILSIAHIPFMHEGKVIGVINIGSRTSSNFYKDLQIFIESLSAQIGGAISRINAENALISSQQNFQMLFETIDDFLFILDIDANIIQANSVVKKRLGYTAEELKGLNVLSVHPPARREEARFIVGEMLAGREAYCPVPLYTKDGTMIPVETRVILGKWDEKDVLFGISRDITERQKTEAALRESEARWNFALEGSGAGVWDWNTETNEVYYSRQWKALIGYSNDEISNSLEEWRKRVHPEDLPLVEVEMNRHFGGKSEIYSNEHRLLCKNGTYKWVLDRGKVVSRLPDGKPLRVIGTHSDISSAKQIEETLRLAIAKEKELNELKSRFVSMASHEFRTPLATILMTGDSLLAYWKRLDEENINTKLSIIKDQVQHLTRIVTDVMQVSKIQEGKVNFTPKKVNFIELCRNVIRDFNADVHLTSKVRFECETECLMVLVDVTLIVQVLNNLVSNAIKYSQPHPDVEVKLIEQNREILLSIKDNGIGIPEADQKDLFQPFYRATNVRKIPGNGLGLSIVKESVRLHGGEVEFESLLGKGTTFVLHFPKQEREII